MPLAPVHRGLPLCRGHPTSPGPWRCLLIQPSRGDSGGPAAGNRRLFQCHRQRLSLWALQQERPSARRITACPPNPETHPGAAPASWCGCCRSPEPPPVGKPHHRVDEVLGASAARPPWGCIVGRAQGPRRGSSLLSGRHGRLRSGPEQRAWSWMGPPVTCPLVHLVPCGVGSRSTREGDLGESLFPHPAPSPSRGSSQESPKTWTLRRCPSGAQSRQGHAQGTGGAGRLSQRGFSSIRHTSPARADREPLPEARHLSSCLRAKSLSPGRLFVTP